MVGGPNTFYPSETRYLTQTKATLFLMGWPRKWN